MQYLGGKSRISKEIAQIINEEGNYIEILRREKQDGKGYIGSNKYGVCDTHTHTHTHTPAFVSLFCGSCSVESKVNAPVKILNDKHEYLIEMFRGVQDGYELPEVISKEDYKHIRENKDEDMVLSGFVGFGCSFGGKWFGGYASNNGGTNYAAQSKRSVLKDMKGLWDAQFFNLDYRDVEIPDGSIVYCDPPYINTTKYTNSAEFDTQEFWEYMRKISKTNTVFVSELTAPSDFEIVWRKPIKRVLDVNKQNIFSSEERLFRLRAESAIISNIDLDKMYNAV